MAKNLHKIFQEHSKNWSNLGIITEEQRNKILDLYITPEKSMVGRLPKIMIILASILIGLGIFLFYGANWQYMPKEFKLLQIFAMVIGLYSGAFFFLSKHEEPPLIGRGLLLLALLSFGASIGLIAQIYHISSHPTNGVLVWALAAVVMGLLIVESWSIFLSTLLFSIWNFWEFIQYNNPNPLFLVVLAILAMAFYRAKSRVGVSILILLLIGYFVQINIYFLIKAQKIYEFREEGLFFIAAVLLSIPFGLLLSTIGRKIEKFDFWNIPARVMGICGWMLFFAPFIFLTIPSRFSNIGSDFNSSILFYSNFSQAKFLPGEYFSLAAICTALILWLRKEGEKSWTLLFGLGIAIFISIIPIKEISLFQTILNIGLFALLFGLPFFSLNDSKTRDWEQIFFVIMTIFVIFSKFIIALVLASYRGLFLYSLGSFILFLSACFVLSYTFKILFSDSKYSYKHIHIFCGILGILTLYILSFCSKSSVLDADRFNISSFISISICVNMIFYIWLYIKKHFRYIIATTAGIFVLTVITLEIPFDIPFALQLLLINFIMFALEGAMIYHSLILNSAKLLNFALLVFVIHIMTRYFDVFWDMLDGAALFFFTGTIVMIGGYLLEKNRRKLLEKIHNESSDKH